MNRYEEQLKVNSVGQMEDKTWIYLRYADDSTLETDTPEKLQSVLETLVRESETKGLRMNIKKTICMMAIKKLITLDTE